jgi:glycosyltransferase involved in cell wall biosynthesis
VASTDALRLSIVMPAYNEAANIAGAIADVIAHVFVIEPAAELVIVDDGSRDATAAIASAFGASDARIRVVCQANSGHGAALMRGVAEARGTYCLLLDSDRQIPLRDFPQTWALGATHDAVLGVREDRADPFHRLLLSAVLRHVLRVLFATRAADANAPYKLVRKEVIQAAAATMPSEPAVPSILLTVYLRARGHRVVEQRVPHRRRAAGDTTLKPLRLARFCGAALRELRAYQRALAAHSAR